MNKKLNSVPSAGTKDESSTTADDLTSSPTCPKPIVSSRYYRGYTIQNHGYYPPDKCIWWEAVNDETQCADFHAHRLRDIIRMIDEECPNGC